MNLAWIAVALAALGVLQGSEVSQRRLLLGALLVGLASASLILVSGTDHLSPSVSVAFDANGVIFLQVVGGLLLLGVGLGWAAGAWLPMLALTIVTVFSTRVLFGFAGWLRPVGVAAAVTAVAAIGWVITSSLRPGRLLVALDLGLLDRQGRSGWRPPTGWTPTAPVLAAGAAAVIALAVPHLWSVLGGTTVAVVAAWLATRRAGRPAWMLVPAALLVGLTLLWTTRLSGPLGGWIPTLIDGPFSPRAAQVLALMVAAAGSVLAAVWPWHGVSVPILLAPLAAGALGAVGTLLVPDGVQWWQPIFAPLALVGMGHGVAWRRMDQVLVAAGMYGCWTGTRTGTLGGMMLVATGWILAVAPSTWIGKLPVAPLVARLLWLFPGGGVLLVQRAGIATETGYAILFSAVVAASIGVFTRPGEVGSVAPARARQHI